LITILLLTLLAASDGPPLELVTAGVDDYRVVVADDRKELAALRPDAWQGNVNILSPNGRLVGVNWPHFLMNSEGRWLTDRVESEGQQLAEFKVLVPSGPVVGYRGTWKFRDYFVSRETHRIWYEPDSQVQVHFIQTELEVIKDLPEISAVWVEFMTQENSCATAAAKMKDGTVATMDVSKTGPLANMHYWDGQELARDGWIAIYGARQGQGGCVALAPRDRASGPIHPRVNNGHVDNIELHMLDARERHLLQTGQRFSLEYLLLAGSDRSDTDWIAPALAKAANTVETLRKSEK
jgi:hypothetical protein